jgi:hypothetical protein
LVRREKSGELALRQDAAGWIFSGVRVLRRRLDIGSEDREGRTLHLDRRGERRVGQPTAGVVARLASTADVAADQGQVWVRRDGLDVIARGADLGADVRDAELAERLLANHLVA